MSRPFLLVRRFFPRFIAASAGVLIAACTGAPPREEGPPPPVIFVHGNGDSAALWLTTVWRFESNGWPRERLFALDAAYPLARADDAKPQEGRTSTAEHMALLAAEVERVRKLTGAQKVVLVGNSRRGNAIRNYIRNGAGAPPRAAGAHRHGRGAGAAAERQDHRLPRQRPDQPAARGCGAGNLRGLAADRRATRPACARQGRRRGRAVGAVQREARRALRVRDPRRRLRDHAYLPLAVPALFRAAA